MAFRGQARLVWPTYKTGKWLLLYHKSDKIFLNHQSEQHRLGNRLEEEHPTELGGACCFGICLNIFWTFHWNHAAPLKYFLEKYSISDYTAEYLLNMTMYRTSLIRRLDEFCTVSSFDDPWRARTDLMHLLGCLILIFMNMFPRLLRQSHLGSSLIFNSPLLFPPATMPLPFCWPTPYFGELVSYYAPELWWHCSRAMAVPRSHCTRFIGCCNDSSLRVRVSFGELIDWWLSYNTR